MIGDQAFPRVQLDISKATFAKLMDSALNETLNPPFDAYASCMNFVLASYWVPYVGLTGYTGSAPYLDGFGAKSVRPQARCKTGKLLNASCATSKSIYISLREL
jgi:hypothetical protein